MPSFKGSLIASALLALAQGQAVITSAKGNSGTSLGLQVDPKNTKDANIISQAEIVTNVVNECGRTLLAGNIDIGEQTEIALAAKQVTKVTKGSDVTVTVSQRTADGSGPFTCDMDLTSNANGITGQVPLTVTQSGKNGGTGDITLKVTMPADMACIGASTGDICTVRCKNAANFGGCFAVQQTDTTPAKNTPSNIATKQTLSGVLAQVEQNKKDLAVAIGSLNAASADKQGLQVADALLQANPTLTQAAAAATSTTATKGTGRKNKGNGNGNANAAGNNNGATTGNGSGRNNGATNGNAAGNNNAATNGNASGRNRNNQRDVQNGLRWAKRRMGY